jgi:AcrR family transcriptional regulator
MVAEQARTARLLWGPPHRPQRGTKPSLSLGRIVEVATAVADAEGLAALSMQRIAGELGFTKMSLYRYTPGKAELTALMLDTALGPPPDVPAGWRPGLRTLGLRMWEAMHRHPWTLEIAVGARVLGPNELGWTEAGLAALAGTGLTGRERLDAFVLVVGHVRSLVQQATASAAPEQELSKVLAGIIAEHGDRYPEVRAAFTETAPGGQDNALEFGLDRILDGLAVLIAERA